MNLVFIKKLLGNAYIAAIFGVAAILFLLKYLQLIFGSSPPLLIFLVAITFASWSGGLGAGIFTTALSVVASAYFLEEPYGSIAIFKSTEMVRIDLLIVVGAICSLIIAHLHKRERQALRAMMEREGRLNLEIAERNRTQAERNLYFKLAESSTEFIGMCNTEGQPFYINDAGLRLVGLDSLEQCLNTPVTEFFFPEDRSFIIDKFFPDVVQRGRCEIEIRLRHFKTQEAVWVIHNAFTLKDLNDNIIGLGTVSVNITERKRAEEALRRSQKDLNRAQAVAHIGNWRMDIRNDVLEWSDENYRIFGRPKETPLRYESFLNVVHPADREFVDTAWKNALTGEPYDIEHRVIADGKIKWVRELAELEFDKNGSLLGAFGTTEDITDIKSSQEALQHERAFLRQVIDATPSMIFVKDRDSRYVLCNDALAKCYGTDSQSIIGLTDANLSSNADEVTHFHRDDLEVINGRQSKLIREEKVTHADGTVHWYNTIKIPLVDGDVCTKLLGVATDITERKRAAELLRIEDQRKDQFLAMLAHELRNPLMPIQNAVQILKSQEACDPKLTWCHEVIDRQVTHMTLLLDDLLDVARIMQDKIRLKIERINLAEAVNNAVETSRPLIESRHQALTVSQTATPLWVEGDRVRLAQVAANLLNNAAKYSNEGGQITLHVTREGTDAVIEVKDNGIGIAPDILPQIFDLFIQADDSLAHSQGGLGIGLTLARELVERHGGTVMATSAGIGLGSTFTVRLPILSTASSTSESQPSESVSLKPKLRILVVDDYADSAFSTMMLLQMEGHDVETADCGMKALELAQVFRPQVVLLDVGLPDLDGYEVAKRLREFPETKNATLIALTGYGQNEDRKRSQSAGFDHHILKPMEFKKLSALLATL